MLEIKEVLRLDAADNNGLAAARWPPITAAAFPMMKGWSVGGMILAIALRCEKHRADGKDTLNGNLTEEFLRADQKGMALDRVYSLTHDVTTASGIRLAFDALCSTRRKALVWCGTPRSSFFMLRHTQANRTASGGMNLETLSINATLSRM